MKKHLIALILLNITFISPLNTMELRTNSQESEEDWTILELDDHAFDQRENLAMVSQEINRQFDGVFRKVSQKNAPDVLIIPQQIFPDLTIDYFFIKKLREQNKHFDKALTLVTQQCTQHIQKNLNGYTVDSPSALLHPLLNGFSPVIQQYAIVTSCKPFETTKTLHVSSDDEKIRTILFHEPTGKCAVSTSSSIFIWNIHTLQLEHTLSVAKEKYLSEHKMMSFNTDGSLLAALGLSYLCIWNLTTDTLINKLRIKKIRNNVIFINNTSYFALIRGPYKKRSIELWECTNTKCSFVKKIVSDEYISYMGCNRLLTYGARHTDTEHKKVALSFPTIFSKLCMLAFDNSQNDKKALKKLEQSHALQQLETKEKDDLQKAITQRIAALTEAKKEALKQLTKDTDDTAGFELKDLKK